MEKNKPTVKTEKEEVKGNILEKFIRFLFGIRTDGKYGKELKALPKKMKRIGFNYYIYGSGKVTAQFAEMIYMVYKTIAPLKVLFQSVTDEGYFSREIIHASLSETQKNALPLFDEEQINESARNVPYNTLVANTRSAYLDFQKAFTAEKMEQIDIVYNGVLTLRSFCTLDYYFMLKKFTPQIKENEFTAKLHFTPVLEDYIAGEIVDFVSASYTILTVTHWPQIIAFIKQYKGSETFDVVAFSSMLEKLNTLKETNVLLNMAKLVQHNYEYEVPVASHSAEIVKPYLENVYGSIKTVLEALFVEQKKKQIAALVGVIFQGKIPVTLSYYTEQESIKYANCGAGTFSWCEALFYVSAFLEAVIKPDLNELMETVAVRGKALTVSGVTKITSTYHDLLDSNNQIRALDQSLDVKFPQGYRIKNLYEHLDKDPDAKIQLTASINSVNTKAGAIIRESMAKINEFYKMILILKNDCTRDMSECIENWKEISRYVQIVPKDQLSVTSVRMENFIKLMSCFGV